MTERPQVYAIVGATATGKTDAGEAIAARLGAEVVCADSRQVFRELDAGTGKPTVEQRERSPHHLFDAIVLGERASAGWYARAAAEVCGAIVARGAAPLLVGGSGLYLAALERGLADEPPHDPALRARLRAELETAGVLALHARLAAVDPATAARLAARDTQRVVRALEVFEASGRPLSWWHAQPPRPPFAATWRVVEIVVSAAVSARRIAARTRAMFEGGLVDEARALVAAGHEDALRRLRAVGYDEALDLVAGRASRAEAEERTSLRTRQLAKRQRTWFRHQVEAVRVEGDDLGADGLAAAVQRALRAAD